MNDEENRSLLMLRKNVDSNSETLLWRALGYLFITKLSI